MDTASRATVLLTLVVSGAVQGVVVGLAVVAVDYAIKISPDSLKICPIVLTGTLVGEADKIGNPLGVFFFYQLLLASIPPAMLLKFSKSDILNSSLVYAETGALGYTILTRSHFIRGSGKDSDTESEDETVETRRTTVFNKSRVSVAEIKWEGQRPVEITIGKERIGTRGIFGCQSAILSDNVLGLPTRFDTEFFWMAAPDGLTLLDYDSNRIKGHFHVNSLRVGDRFITTPISGLGHDYLEFDQHPLASTEELIVTFLLMEILRRGRFNNNTGTIDRSKLWRNPSFANLSRRLRRSTI